MLEWIVSSSVLILAVVLLRRLLRGKISPRLQYAVWLIVLLRLLVPLNIGSAKVSVQNVVHEADTKISEQVVTYVNYELPDISISEPDPALPEAEREVQYEQNVAEYEAQVEAAKAETGTPVTLSDILQYVWYGGMAAMALWFIGTNLVFRARLLRSRRRMEYACRLPVYVTDAVETPCLFGRAVYVTREAAEEAGALRHSVEHELTHHRRGDHIWAVLRCICLVLHWYNPLVWLAAALSRRDAELACDEATIQRLGEAERAAYGRTLIETACEKPATLLRTATTMNCGKSGLKERIRLIAKRPKTAVYAVVILILAAVIVTGCTFTGAQEKQPVPSWSDQYVEGKVNIAVTLTGLSPETPAYYAPEAQDEWRGLLDEAVSKARSGSYVSEGAYLLGQFIVYGGQKLYFNTDGSLSDLDENYLISAADAAPLRELLDETLDSLGVSGHVSPADIHDLRSATFEFYGGTATLTDEAELAEIERILSSSSATYPSQCGFASVMRLERADGTVLSLGMAGDGCGVWQSNGWFYSYPGDNYALYSLFAAQLIHDLDAGTVFSDYYGGALLRYLDWAHYCDKFDYDACFELMDELFEHAKTDYDVMTVCLNNTQSLDGALAEAYSYHLVQLYEYAPAEFAAAFHDVPEDQQKVLLNMLTFELDISSDELRAQLREQLGEYAPEPWSAMSLAELMSTIRAADIEYLACEGTGELTAEQLALALNAAAANQTALDAAGFDAWCSLTAYLTDKNGSGAERLVLRAGAEENFVSVQHETKAGTREGVFEDSELYWLVRNSCSTDLALEAENLEKYRDIIEARAEETVRSAEKTDGSPAFSGYELTRFELMDSFGSVEVFRYEVYAWDAAYIPQGDVTTLPLAGGMYVDAEGRVAGYEPDTYFAVKTAADGSFDYRFLTSELFLGANEALGRESARSYVRAAFTERGWMPVMLCMAADEVLEGLGELPEYGPSEEEYAWKLLLSAREPLYDFKFVRLEPSYTDLTVTETYFETAELSPNTPVILWATFPGDAPQFGLSFRDGSGEQWQLSINADWSSDEQAVALSTYFMQD